MSRRYSLQLPPMSYANKAKAAVLSPAAGQTLSIYNIHLTNRSGGTIDLGALIRLAAVNTALKFLNFTAPGPSVDATDAFLGGAPQTLFTTNNDDGFVVQAPKAFNLIAFMLTQAQSGGPIYAYEYFDGTSFVALPNILSTPTWAVGENVLMFPNPQDWVPGTTGAVGGFANLYTLFVRATNAGGQDVIASDFWMARLIEFAPQLLNNQIFSINYHDEYPLQLDSGEGLLPYFSGADPRNLVAAKYISY